MRLFLNVSCWLAGSLLMHFMREAYGWGAWWATMLAVIYIMIVQWAIGRMEQA